MGSIPLLGQLICFSLSSAFLPSIVKWILDSRQKKSSEEQTLLSELRDMKKELAQISMVDEFARHAKLQRKITKSQEDLKKITNSRMLSTTAKKAVATQVVNVLLGICILYMLWMHKYEPVMFMPSGWLFPLEGILSWPTGQTGAISVAAWLSLSRISIRVLSGLK